MADETLVVNSDTFPQIQKSSSIVVNQTYSWINNASFYAAVNPTYYLFYHNSVRRLSWWLDGYNPYFHNEQNGIFSTRLASSLVNSIGEAIFGRELLFKNVGQEKDKSLANQSLKNVGKWAKESEFQQSCKKAIKYALGLGTSLLKLNVSKGKDLWVEAVRLDYFYFEVDARNKLKQLVCLLKGYSNAMVSPKGSPSTDNYYLVEKRFYKYEKEITFVRDETDNLVPQEKIIEVPMVTYQVHKYAGNHVTGNAYDPTLREDVRWDSVPKKVRESIKQDYSTLRIGEEQKLPFTDLGAELIMRDEGNISLPNIPFGTSILENIVAYLMGYDIAYSYFFRDMYQGKGIVMLPKAFSQNKAKSGTSALDSPFAGLDTSMFYAYDTMSMETKQGMIEKVQFNLRGQEWSQIRDYLIENIAMTLQLSPRTIASFLQGGAIKTATQVSSEDSASISFVETHRAVFEKPINRLLKTVMAFYGMPDQVEIRYSKEGVINTNELLQRIMMEKQAGLIDDYSALAEWMFDSDEEQVLERYQKIEEQKQKQMQEQMAMAESQSIM